MEVPDAICLIHITDGAAVLGGESDRQVEILPSVPADPLLSRMTVMHGAKVKFAMRFALMGPSGWIKLPPGKTPTKHTRVDSVAHNMDITIRYCSTYQSRRSYGYACEIISYHLDPALSR